MKNFKLLLILLVAFNLTSCAYYREYDREQSFKDAENRGQSTLIEAEGAKKAMIEEAKAENESASLKAEAKIKIATAEAQAKIEDAKGVAEANRIIGKSLEDNPNYLKYLMISNLKDGKGDRVYIATEAGMPILEAK